MKILRCPKDAVYLLVHIVVVLIGCLFLQTDMAPYDIALGSTLISAGVTGLTLFIYVRILHKETDTLSNIREFNLVRIFPTRSVTIKTEYEKRLRKLSRSRHSRHHIDILGFGLRHLREDYSQNFLTWSKKAKVRILVIDPEFPDVCKSVASQRDEEEGDESGVIRGDVQTLVKECRELGLLEKDSNFDIRLYRCLPSVNIFHIDNYVFWGPY